MPYDYAIIGAGAFGAWTAKDLRESGASVVLLDAYGAGNSRSSSGGETRIIRAGYGPDDLYTRWAIRSLPLWQELFARTGRNLFHRTGVMWLSHDDDPHVQGMWALLQRLNVSCVKLSGEEIRKRYRQLRFDDVTLGVLEPDAGILMARQAVQTLVRHMVDDLGVEFRAAAVQPPRGENKLAEIKTGTAESISAGTFIFACGPWLPKLFPDLLRNRIFPTRQEVCFFGPPPGNRNFDSPQMPAWLHHTHPDRPYALPNLEGRGFKIALDTHGPAFDPDTGSRVVSQATVDRVRGYLKQHVPALAEAPVIETRVCQYENTWNGDFLIDRHPQLENVWLAGGGSGHGFKHGPAVGEYLGARLLKDAAREPRFSFISKQRNQAREVF